MESSRQRGLLAEPGQEILQTVYVLEHSCPAVGPER